MFNFKMEKTRNTLFKMLWGVVLDLILYKYVLIQQYVTESRQSSLTVHLAQTNLQ